jgi:tetratricopeptide (TPR) repeat protein
MGQLEKSQQVYETLLEQKPVERAKAPIYHQLGHIKDEQGKYEEAITFYEKGLEILTKALDPNHLDLAASYNNIGIAYKNMADHPKALSYYEKSLAIRIILIWLLPTIISVSHIETWVIFQKHFRTTKKHLQFNNNHFH